MSAATWYILAGVLILLVLVAFFGGGGGRSPARRLGAMVRQADNRDVILSEIGIVVGGVLLALGLLHTILLYTVLGFILIVAALLRAVIHHSAA
jgi:hypothetical protein